MVWIFVKYVEAPADIVSPPVTILGQAIGILVGVLGIAIFAVPAGLIGSGLMEAMDENKREKELGEYYDRFRKVFLRNANKALRIPGKHLRHAQAPCTLGLHGDSFTYAQADFAKAIISRRRGQGRLSVG